MGYVKRLLASLAGLSFSAAGRLNVWWHLIQLTFIGCIMNPVVAQNQLPPLSVTYTNDNVSEEHIQSYFEKLENNFDELDTALSISMYEFGSPVGDIDVAFRASYTPERIIDGQGILVTISVSPLTSISPILVHEEHIYISSSSDIQADLTTIVFLYINGQCETADSFLYNIQTSLPESHEYYREPVLSFYKGECAVQQNDFEAAVKHFTDASSHNPDHVPYIAASINLAWTYIQLENNVTAFEIVADLPDLADYMFWGKDSKVLILSRRAQLYALAYRYDDAIADLNAALELDPDNPELYVLRGQMYLYLYEWDSSLADYNRAIDLDPDYADAYYYRGVLYYSILQTGVELRPEALADFQHYLELAPNGDHAADAARYVEQIETELATLHE